MCKIISSKDWIKSFDNTKLYYAKDIPQPPKAIIIFLHGFSEHLHRYEKLKDKLNNYGYGVYRYDIRGHGRSEGRRGHIKSFEDFFIDTDIIVDLARYENKNLPIFMMGYSLGGFISIAYGIKYNNKLDGQILSSPAIMRPPLVKRYISTILRIIGFFYPNLIIKNGTLKHFYKSCYTSKEHSDDLVLKEATLKFFIEFLVKGIKWLNKNLCDYNLPCLILHGERDKVILKEASERFYSNIKSTDKELRLYSELEHEPFNEILEDRIFSDINEWILERIDKDKRLVI